GWGGAGVGGGGTGGGGGGGRGGGGGGTPLASVRLAKFADLAVAMAAAPAQPVVLDVRRRLEWAESHIAGARHIPLYELADRAGELRPARCGGTARTAYAPSWPPRLPPGRGRTGAN